TCPHVHAVTSERVCARFAGGQGGSPADGVERRIRWPGPQGGEELLGCSTPHRQLVSWLEAPGCDHRQDEDPTVAEQCLINVRVERADVFGDMGQVELDRPATTRLEVNEERTLLRVDDVPGARLCAQELLRCALAP